MIFRLPGEESASNAQHLYETLRSAGYSPIVVPYWNEKASTRETRQFPLLAGTGLNEVPRLSAHAFRQRFGYDLDVFDLSAHSIAIRDIRTDTVLSESVWNQKLRGVASVSHDLLKSINPAVVFIAHGAEVISRILAVVASRLGIRYLYWESPFFPDYHFVDPIGPHFFRDACYIDKYWSQNPELLDASHYQSEGSKFVAAWQSGKRSKYPQQSLEGAFCRLQRWAESDSRPILFIPGQLPHDANVTVSLRNYEDYRGICLDIVRGVPPTWRVVFKPHPRDTTAQAWDILSEHGVHVAKDISIHDMFDMVDAVATHSSNVGLEALMAGLPVIVWGDPIYARRGLTEDLSAPAEIRSLLDSGLLQPPPWDKVLTLVGQILQEALVKHGDSNRLSQMIGLAGSSLPPPRLPWYGLPVTQLARAAGTLNRELQQGKKINRAIADLPDADRSILCDRFGDELLQHQFGGPRAPKTGFVEVQSPIDFKQLFASSFLEDVEFNRTDLQNCYDPAVAISKIGREIRIRNSVVLEVVNAHERSWAIQALTASDIRQLVTSCLPRVRCEVFGLADRYLTARPDSHPSMIVALRCAENPPLSPNCLQKLLTTPVPYTSMELPPQAFTYSIKPTNIGGRRLIPLHQAGHIVFGAQFRVPPGKWQAIFRLRLEPSRQRALLKWPRQHAPRLTIDAYRVGENIVAIADTNLASAGSPVLEFESESGSLYEFRIFLHRKTNAQMLEFFGVELRPHSLRH